MEREGILKAVGLMEQVLYAQEKVVDMELKYIQRIMGPGLLRKLYM
jgi:hypothetical protein